MRLGPAGAQQLPHHREFQISKCNLSCEIFKGDKKRLPRAVAAVNEELVIIRRRDCWLGLGWLSSSFWR